MSNRITNLATGLIFSCAFPSNKAPFSSEFSTRDRVLCTYSDAKRYLICWIVCMLKSALKIDCCAHIHTFGRGCRYYGLSRSIPLFAFTPPIIPLILFWFSDSNFFPLQNIPKNAYMQKAGDSWDISPQIFLDFPQNFRLRTRNQYCTQAIARGSTI